MDAYDGGSNAPREPDGPTAPEGAERAEGAERSVRSDQPVDSDPPVGSTPGRAPVPAQPSRPSSFAPLPEPPLYDPEAAASASVSALLPEGRTGVAALSLRYQIGAALALAVVAVAAFVHLGMVFLHVAPSNTMTKQHGKAIDDWIYPEFEQNWKLFAPNPLQQNIAVQVRAEIRAADGSSRTTGWYDLSAEDGQAIDGNLLPSHTQQNELRRSWDFFLATHDADNRPAGLRGSLSETYLRRIVVLRLDRDDAAGRGGAVERVQVRSRTTNVAPPKWSDEQVSATPVYRVLPWWSVLADEARGGVR
jgi:hypothetical protein